MFLIKEQQKIALSQTQGEKPRYHLNSRRISFGHSSSVTGSPVRAYLRRPVQADAPRGYSGKPRRCLTPTGSSLCASETRTCPYQRKIFRYGFILSTSAGFVKGKLDVSAQFPVKFHKNGLYARSQGDSFLILVEDTSQNRELLKSLVDLDISIHNTTNYKVPLKIGVCPIPRYNPALSLSLYIDRANIAKKYTSARNTNYICYFTDDMNKKLNMKNMIESEMVRALSKGEFVVYYQPKYELANDTIIGAEALVRWNHKEKGIISPGVFIPVFERNGFIVDLDFYVYEQVLKMQKHRLDMGKKVIPISMNVSRCHLSDTNFVDKLEAVVAKYKVPKQYIEMEITESIFSQEDSSAIALIYNLKEHGFTISMDDFGSAYSSLNLLRKVQIDTLKIDKVFIDSTEDVQRSQVIVEEIINMASKIHVKTICEGVETQSQRDFLKNAGCNMVQGYFYSKPLPYEDFSDLLNSSK